MPKQRYLLLNYCAKAHSLRDGFDTVADFLSQDFVLPDIWTGFDFHDPPRDAFTREVIPALCAEYQSTEGMLSNSHYLERRTSPKSRTFLSRDRIDYSLYEQETSIYPTLFEWGDRLAQSIHPYFGVCHQQLLVASRYEKKLDSLPATVNLHGIPDFGNVTYLGNPLAELVGEDLLKSCEFESMSRESWGWILKICSEPWNVSSYVLRKKHKAIMEQLYPTGLFQANRVNWKRLDLHMDRGI